MIKTEKGKIELDGSIPCLMGDVMTILRGFRIYVSGVFNPKAADDFLRECIRLSFLSEEEMLEEMKRGIQK